MIGPADEPPKDAAEDSVTVQLTDVDRGACALLRVARANGGARSSALAVLCLGGEAVAVGEPASISIETREPLVRWSCRVEGESLALVAELEAVSVPVAFDDALAQAA